MKRAHRHFERRLSSERHFNCPIFSDRFPRTDTSRMRNLADSAPQSAFFRTRRSRWTGSHTRFVVWHPSCSHSGRYRRRRAFYSFIASKPTLPHLNAVNLKCGDQCGRIRSSEEARRAAVDYRSDATMLFATEEVAAIYKSYTTALRSPAQSAYSYLISHRSQGKHHEGIPGFHRCFPHRSRLLICTRRSQESRGARVALSRASCPEHLRTK